MASSKAASGSTQSKRSSSKGSGPKARRSGSSRSGSPARGASSRSKASASARSRSGGSRSTNGARASGVGQRVARRVGASRAGKAVEGESRSSASQNANGTVDMLKSAASKASGPAVAAGAAAAGWPAVWYSESRATQETARCRSRARSLGRAWWTSTYDPQRSESARQASGSARPRRTFPRTSRGLAIRPSESGRSSARPAPPMIDSDRAQSRGER